ncbi:hypothetical protein [Candidatus Poriferisodalis sp.]|uniref:hypothetical protein n=1 Tax=Candidatus Poriferisodalis sp. TaxID=3101277 RepID=UPI003B0139EB
MTREEEVTTAGEAYARRLDAVVAGYRGEAATAEMLLDDDDASVRAAALGALARCGALGAGQIRRALVDEAAAVRCRAAELAPAEVELVGLLGDPDASVVEAVAAALGERDRDPDSVGELCRIASGHDDPLCRESAVAALGAIAAGLDAGAHAPSDAAAISESRRETHHDAAADPKLTAGAPHEAARGMAFEALLAAMDDRPQIRRRALLGLFQFDDERAAAAVQAALEDRDRQVRAVVGELLGVPVR